MGEMDSSSDSAFKEFETMEWGYRAMFVLLDSYYRKGLRTIGDMIMRYAPPMENMTDNYIAFVCKSSGIAADIEITSTNRDVMIPIVSAMAKMENGIAPNIKDIEGGWRLFVTHKP